jgi:hypothetical protein
VSSRLQADLEHVPEVLSAITEEKLAEMQLALSLVWKRFLYSSYSVYNRTIQELRSTENTSKELPDQSPLEDGALAPQPRDRLPALQSSRQLLRDPEGHEFSEGKTLAHVFV